MIGIRIQGLKQNGSEYKTVVAIEISDGNSETGAQMLSNFGYLICLRHMVSLFPFIRARHDLNYHLI